MKQQKWVLCPICGNKTNTQVREDTVLKNFPLYCAKCKNESIVEIENLKLDIIKEPDEERGADKKHKC